MRSNSNRSGTIAAIPTGTRPSNSFNTKSSTTVDPNVILDSIDSYGTRPIAAAVASTKQDEQQQQLPAESNFDPVDFLNHHFLTESTLVSSLPSLRSAIRDRTAMLSDSISTSIQRQSDLADSTAKDVARAKTAILALHDRVTLVQSKALQSERAVLEITRDMKRLDYAKRHLQRTITALKRLHMLLHAAEQLRLSAVAEPYPDYRSAANLVDATRLLLGHFDGYMGSIPKMRLLRDAVGNIGEDLRRGILQGFHDVGFHDAHDLREAAANSQEEEDKMPIMTTDVLSDACLVIDALGLSVRDDFIKTFCKEHLAPYTEQFDPLPATASSSSVPKTTSKQSFKIRMPTDGSTSTASDSENTSGSGEPFSLDQIEKRYAWFRDLLRDIHEKFSTVFPRHWTLHYKLSHAFLSLTGDHLKILLGKGKGSDSDKENVTVLLKALQKTILFEKEMMAWLQREYDTIFLEGKGKKKTRGEDGGRGESTVPDVSNMGDIDDALIGEDGAGLEFDEDGRAVAASSAQGIKIKYERKMKQGKGARRGGDDLSGGRDMLERKDEEVKPVPTLLGVASSVFDPHMRPYIALEEQNMDEQLQESRRDDTVDTRGELPVFTSSTALFVYIKNSITRCTVLTQGKTFFLLYVAFKATLRKYAAVLENKFPQALNIAGAAIGGININVNVSSLPSTFGGGSSKDSGAVSGVYRIPPGEEVTICHVIDTCEYCADTVEALEDLIRDKINDEFKRKIDMSNEQETFHDVTARGIRVLVSGLEQRTEPALKEMSNKNWGSLDVVGEESAYVRSMHNAIQPFVVTVQELIPSSYFRNFCDRFAAAFTSSYYNALIRQKRISESGTQQLLLDVYNLKTLLLKLPVLEKSKSSIDDDNDNSRSPPRGTPGSRIPPAMYTKMVTKQFAKIELLLKLVGTPPELLIDVFKAQWEGGSALNLQTVMNLKGMNRKEQTTMLEKFGLDSETAQRGAAAGSTSSTVTEHVQILQEKSSDVAANLSQMRQKVDDFRKAFR